MTWPAYLVLSLVTLSLLVRRTSPGWRKPT